MGDERTVTWPSRSSRPTCKGKDGDYFIDVLLLCPLKSKYCRVKFKFTHLKHDILNLPLVHTKQEANFSSGVIKIQSLELLTSVTRALMFFVFFFCFLNFWDKNCICPLSASLQQRASAAGADLTVGIRLSVSLFPLTGGKMCFAFELNLY